MGNGPQHFDEIDFILRDTLREDAKVSANRTKVWGILRSRIDAQHQPVRRQIGLGNLSYLSPREWTLDCHLMSLARVVH